MLVWPFPAFSNHLATFQNFRKNHIFRTIRNREFGIRNRRKFHPFSKFRPKKWQFFDTDFNFRAPFLGIPEFSRHFQNIKSVQNWVGFKSRRVRKNSMRAKKKLHKFVPISHTSRISPGGKSEAARPEGTMCGAAGTRMGTHVPQMRTNMVYNVVKRTNMV